MFWWWLCSEVLCLERPLENFETVRPKQSLKIRLKNTDCGARLFFYTMQIPCGNCSNWSGIAQTYYRSIFSRLCNGILKTFGRLYQLFSELYHTLRCLHRTQCSVYHIFCIRRTRIPELRRLMRLAVLRRHMTTIVIFSAKTFKLHEFRFVQINCHGLSSEKIEIQRGYGTSKPGMRQVTSPVARL